MSRLRWSSVAAVVGCLALIASALPAQPASAAEGTAPVLGLPYADSDRPEVQYITATSDSEVVSLGGKVTKDGVRIATVVFEKISDEMWRSLPIVVPELGSFTLSMTAVDADGDHGTGKKLLNYLAFPEVVSHSVEDAEVTIENPHITAVGQLRFYDPRLRDFVAMPEGITPPSVRLRASSAKTVRGTVGADGRYSVTTTIVTGFGPSYDLPVEVEIVPTSQVGTFGHAEGAVLIGTGTVHATASLGRVTIVPTELHVKYPANATVAGAVWRKVGDTWVVVPGVTVEIRRPNRLIYTDVTDKNGRFSMTLPEREITEVKATALSPFLYGGKSVDPFDTVKIIVQQKSTLTWRSRSLSASSWFDFGVQILPVRPSGRVGRVYLERAKPGSSTWAKLGYVTTNAEYGQAKGGIYLVHPSWKYRLHFLGNPYMAASVSSAITLPRDDTRIVNNKVSPSRLAAGSKFTISGKAQKLSGSTFVSVGNRAEIQVFFCAKGAKTWTYKGSAYTSSTGSFSKKFTAKKDGYWAAVWFTTSSKWVNAYGPDLFVDVTSASSTASSDATWTPPPLGGVTPSGPLADLSLVTTP